MSSDEDWSDDDSDIDRVDVTCLFCDHLSHNIDAAWDHCEKQHNFKIVHFAKQHHMDCIQYIQFVNFIRQKELSVEDLMKLGVSDKPWNTEEFLKPYRMDDPLLQFDIEEELDIENSGPCYEVAERGDDLTFTCLSTGSSQNKLTSVIGQNEMHEKSDIQSHVTASGDQPTTLCNNDDLKMDSRCTKRKLQDVDDRDPSREHIAQLYQQLENAEIQNQQLENQLKRAVEDLKQMRLAAADFFLPSEEDNVTSTTPKNSLSAEDEAYFDSYSHFSIHEEMLKDKVRTEGYRDFIYSNPDVFKDKVVLDVGCGTGILTMFAASAGAKLVIGVEQSDIIHHAYQIVRENKLEDKVKLIKGRMEDVELPVEKVDIIISEWMGYFLLFESMLDSVIFARDKYCTDTGIVYPDRSTMYLALLSDEEMYKERIGFWKDVYGFNMDCITKVVVREAAISTVDAAKIVSSDVLFKDFDICRCSTSDLQFTEDFSLVCCRDAIVHAVVGYFNVYFQQKCKKEVVICTGPQCTSTHWKQTVFLLHNPLKVKKDEVIKGSIVISKCRREQRSLKVKLKVGEQTETYIMQ